MGDDLLHEKVIAVLRGIFDPEIPVNIYEMGLVYGVGVTQEGGVKIEMTLTSPACPIADVVVGEVERKVGEIDGVSEVRVDLVWDPPWTMERMTEAARLQLGL